VTQAREALDQSGLAAGAVCLRYPQSQFRAGALTAPDPQVRAAAVSLTIEAGQAAIALGAKELVIWSAFDGYDYPLQVKERENDWLFLSFII
jgi:L-rhamnose isomerase